MQFEIKVDINGRWHPLQIERIYTGDSIEKFRVTGGKHPIIIQCNRPALKATHSNKAIKWQFAEGELNTDPRKIESTTMALYNTFKAIEEWLLKNDP